MLPVRQRCPSCGEYFMGSDAVGDDCPSCRNKPIFGGTDLRMLGALKDPQKILSDKNKIINKIKEIQNQCDEAGAIQSYNTCVSLLRFIDENKLDY